MSESLKDKTIKGIGWSFADNISNQGITFLIGIVLARLLSPQEFGIIGIITIFLAIFNSIVDSGFSSALIRKIDAGKKDYNTVFIFNLIISLLLYVLLYFTAPLISNFFELPQLITLLRVMGIIVIINAFSIIQRTMLVKKVDFKTQTKISIIASVTSGVLGIILALNNYGVWSLAGQQISRQLLNSIFLWIFNKTWFPSMQFSLQSFKDLFSFGWKLLVIGLISTIWEEIYQAVIGKFYSPATLGQFTRANQFRNITSRNFSTIIQRVSYPVLSSIQDDNIRLKFAFKKVIKTTTLVTFTTMLGMGAIAKPLILVLIGSKWLTAVVFLQIICFSGVWNPLQALNNNLMQVKGKSGLLLKLEILKRTIAIIPIFLGIFIDILWMLWASVIANFLIYCINAHFAGKSINYPLIEQIKDILPSLIIALITGSMVWSISWINFSPFILLPIQIFAGFIIILIICETFKRKEYFEIKNIVITYINNFKSKKKYEKKI